jgi:hypothetical protein
MHRTGRFNLQQVEWYTKREVFTKAISTVIFWVHNIEIVTKVINASEESTASCSKHSKERARFTDIRISMWEWLLPGIFSG